MRIRNVAIVGGTHGNELTGIYLLRRWAMVRSEIIRSSFKTNLFLGNPKAAALNQRFIDEDLNRCFTKSSLASSEKVSYESLRAAYLNQLIGPKDAAKHDFVIDMHTTTSNSGTMIALLDEKPFSLSLAAYIVTKLPNARIHYIPSIEGDLPYLNSVCPHSLGVEIGPIPQGLLRSDICKLTIEVVQHALDYVQALNEGSEPSLPKSVEVFRFKEVVYYPQKDGIISAMIHSSLQGADYKPLKPGAPMFELIDGTILHYEGVDTVYPVFINEAAYYEKNVAMSLCTNESFSLSYYESKPA